MTLPIENLNSLIIEFKNDKKILKFLQQKKRTQMKTVNFLKNIDNREVVQMELKKKFEHKGFNFAIIIEPNDSPKWYTLINFENGGRIAMYLETKKTIKDFEEKSKISIDNIISRIGYDSFKNTILQHPPIN